MVKSQATDSGPDSRKLWTAMPGASYVNNWNNFDVDRVSAITSMFSELGYEVPVMTLPTSINSTKKVQRFKKS